VLYFRFSSIVIAIIALIVALLVWRDAASAYWLGDPDGAPEVLHSDPRIEFASTDDTLLVHLLQGTRPATTSVDLIIDQARSVLREAPLEAGAMRRLGFADVITGKPALRGQLKIAERISRRDLQNQVALLGLTAKEGDIAAALIHLDRLSTVFPRVGTQFFTPLESFLANDEGRRQLIAYRERRWFTSFMDVAANRAKDPRNVAALLREARLPLSQGRSIMQRLVDRLIAQNRYDAARDLAIGYGRADQAVLDDFRMTRKTVDPAFAPLTWRLPGEDLVRASQPRDGALDVALSPGKPIAVLERVTHFPSGSYVLEQQVNKAEERTELFAKWELRCERSNDHTVVWQQPVPLQTDQVHYRSEVRIPSDCPLQYWRLNVLADGIQSDARFQIASLSLERTTAD